MFWLLCAFGSAFFAGITAILAKIGMEKVNSTLATALRTVVEQLTDGGMAPLEYKEVRGMEGVKEASYELPGRMVLLMAWVMVFVAGKAGEVRKIPKNELGFICLSGIATGASWLCYFRALQLGDVNKVAPIDKSSTVLTILLAFLLLGEPITPPKAAGVLGIGAGTLLMLDRKAPASGAKQGRGWLFYAVLSAVFASLTSIFGKIGVSGVDSNLGTAIRTVVVLAMAWLMVLITGQQRGLRRLSRKNWLFLVLSGVTTGLSWLCYYRALQDGPASVVVPIDKLSILVTLAFSYFVFHERLSKKSAIGLVLIVAGTLAMLI